MSLPRQWADNQGGPWSIIRDNQLRTVLETAAALTFGYGVHSSTPGTVTQTGALSVQVAAGTIVFAKGVAHTLPSAVAYSGLTTGATNYLWGKLTRTAGDRAQVINPDTWALTLTHNTTGTAPTSEHFILAEIAVGSAIQEIDSSPAGKFIGWGTPVSIGSANSAGTAQTYARSDHVHALADASVALSALEEDVAAGDEFQDQARKLRRLILFVGMLMGGPPPGLEDDFAMAAGET